MSRPPASGLTRRDVTAALALGGLGLAAPWAQAQTAPAAPLARLRIFIPANEGGGWDQTGRALGSALLASSAVKEVVYENVGGKGGTLGLARYVEKYDADPDTILMGGLVMVGAIALQKPKVDMAQVQPVARLTSDYEVVAVRADSPLMTTKDVVAQMRAQPGKLAVAGGSAGGVDHMYAGMLARIATKPSDLVYQPYPGGAQVVEALMSGKAAIGVSGYSEFSEGIASGKLRAIGVSSKRSFLGIPSAREQGTDAELANWRGVFTGKGIPAARRDVLLAAVRRATESDDWKKAVRRNNWDSYWLEGRDLPTFLDFESQMAGVMVYLLKLQPS